MPLPAFRFAILGARQLSKPLVRVVIRRAHRDGAVTRAVCVRLGRLSLGVARVVSKWDNEEARAAQRLSRPAADGAETADTRLAVAPHSRLLLHGAAATRGKVKLFVRPVQSALAAFREAYRAEHAEEELVASGAEMLVEFIVFLLLAALLYAEISYAAALAGEKERALLLRIEKLEEEVKKLSDRRDEEEAEVCTVSEQREAEICSRVEYLKSILGFIPRVLDRVRGKDEE